MANMPFMGLSQRNFLKIHYPISGDTRYTWRHCNYETESKTDVQYDHQ